MVERQLEQGFAFTGTQRQGYFHFPLSVGYALRKQVSIQLQQVTYLTSVADTVSGMRFVYASGNKKCRFAASHQVNPSTKVPSWTKTGTSIGTTRATCNANITAAQAGLPYNYTVEFEIK